MEAFSITLKLAFRNLVRNKRRSVAVLLTIIAGTSSLFLFDGFNTGIMNQYRENTIHARYGYGQINSKGYHDQVYEKPWDHWIEDADRVLSEIRSIPQVTHVFPRIEFYGLLNNGQISLSGRGQGIDGLAEMGFFNTLNIVEGKALSDEIDGLVLGQGLAKSLNARVGDRITLLANTIYGSINGVDLVVTGIFHTGAKEFDDVVFRLPLKLSQELLDTKKIEKFALGLDQLSSWDQVTEEITKNHQGLEAIPFAVLDKVYYQHAVDWLGSQFQVIKLIILVIVLLGIFNTVSTSVLERKQEVGNLRANGESAGQVISLFLTEGGILGLIGAMIGIAFTILLNMSILGNGILMPPSPGITRQFRVFIELQLFGSAESFLLCLLCVIIGTFFASVQVVRMPIGKALRSL
ncbi:MAG: ABC transporter permease [Oligoflexales bacterium]